MVEMRFKMHCDAILFLKYLLARLDFKQESKLEVIGRHIELTADLRDWTF